MLSQKAKFHFLWLEYSVVRAGVCVCMYVSVYVCIYVSSISSLSKQCTFLNFSWLFPIDVDKQQLQGKYTSCCLSRAWDTGCALLHFIPAQIFYSFSHHPTVWGHWLSVVKHLPMISRLRWQSQDLKPRCLVPESVLSIPPLYRHMRLLGFSCSVVSKCW